MPRRRRSISVAALEEQWKALVAEYNLARCTALRSGAGADELSELDLRYSLRIDNAFQELKRAESLESLSAFLTLSRKQSLRYY
jgi:hypothetical protein